MIILSLRRAVIERIKAALPSVGGRVYQAFLAPVDAAAPYYVTVKVGDERGDVNIPWIGFPAVEVRLYSKPLSFISLDELEGQVIQVLQGVPITDPQTGKVYQLRWLPGFGDFNDPQQNLIGKLVRFQAVRIVERPNIA